MPARKPATPDPDAGTEPATPEPAPVRLGTRPGDVFIVPAHADLPEITVTPTGVALSTTDADRVHQAATACGVTLIDKES